VADPVSTLLSESLRAQLLMLGELRSLRASQAGVNRALVAARIGTAGGGVSVGTMATGFGRLGTAITVAVAAFTLLKRTFDAGRDTLQALADLRLFGGGSTGQSAQAATLFAAVGNSATQVADIAATLRTNIAAGGFARGAASQLGVGTVLPRGLGSTNDVQILLQVAAALRRVTSEEEARRLAIRLGLPDLLRFRTLTEEQFAATRRIADFQQQVLGAGAEGRIQQFTADLNNLLSVVKLGPAVFTDFVLRLLGYKGQAGGGPGNAIQQNTSALQQNTVAIGQMRAIFGGGERARGAVPAGLRGELLRKAMESDAIKLGAFSL